MLPEAANHHFSGLSFLVVPKATGHERNDVASVFACFCIMERRWEPCNFHGPSKLGRSKHEEKG